MLVRDVPLIGRDAELQEIMTALAQAPAAAVIISGPAGVGKSRLAAEAASAVARTGRNISQVIATDGGTAIPYGPFAALLPDIATLASRPIDLLYILRGAIADRAEGGPPILLVVDDAQFLDAESAALVHHLVVTGACGLVATLRAPDRVAHSIVSLWKDGLARRIDVQPLTRDQSDALVASYFGGPVAGSALRWLWDISGGNPLFVRELLIAAQQTGSAYEQDQIWFLRLPLPAPSRLTDLIASRLSSVTAATAEVVDLLAIGEPLGFDELVKIAGHAAVEDAENRDLITVRVDQRRSQVRLRHPLYREIVRQRIPRTRLRRLSATLAEALEGTGVRRRDDIMRIARWRLDAGSPGDPGLLERAAREARAVRDLDLASRLARAALTAGGGVAAGLILGETEFFAGRPDEAEKVFASLAPACHTDEERAMLAGARAYNLGVLIGDEPAARAVINDALAAITEDVPRRHLLARQAIWDAYSGRFATALATTEELLRGTDEIALLWGQQARAVAMAFLGRTHDAVETSYLALEHHRSRLQKSAPYDALLDNRLPEAQLVGAVIGHLLGGRLEAAYTDARSGYESGLDLSDKEVLATFCVLLGWVLVERGFMADAAKVFREGTAVNRQLSDPGPLRWCVAGVAMAEAMSGNAAAASEAEVELSALPSHWMAALDPHLVDRGRGWLLIVSGQLTAARTHFAAAAASAHTLDHFTAEAILLHDLVRLGEAEAVGPRLDELSSIVDGDLIPAFAAHAAARAARDPLRLEQAAEWFEKLGALLVASETAHAAATAYRARGEGRQASAMAREYARLQDLCGTQSVLIMDVDAVVPLTRRELEIAGLAAAGLSSKAIAERLFVSARTVDNHLQRVYAKLGVTGRDSLKTALGLRATE